MGIREQMIIVLSAIACYGHILECNDNWILYTVNKLSEHGDSYTGVLN